MLIIVQWANTPNLSYQAVHLAVFITLPDTSALLSGIMAYGIRDRKKNTLLFSKLLGQGYLYTIENGLKRINYILNSHLISKKSKPEKQQWIYRYLGYIIPP